MSEQSAEGGNLHEDIKEITGELISTIGAAKEYFSPEEQKVRDEKLMVLKSHIRDIGFEKIRRALVDILDEGEGTLQDMVDHYKKRLVTIVPQREQEGVAPQINQEMASLSLQLPDQTRKMGRVYGAIGFITAWQIEDQEKAGQTQTPPSLN